MQDFPNKPYYKPEEAADYLSVTADTIRKMCRKGQIEGARLVGKQWRIPRKWLLAEDQQPVKQDPEKDSSS